VKFYLVRHGQSLDENKDSLRHLSEKGKHDVQKTAEFLNKAQIKVEIILSSRKTRAIQTAEILSCILNSSGSVELIDGISPNDSAVAFIDNTEFEFDNIMLVGHLPFLSHLASLLLTCESNTVNILFPTSSVVCFERMGSGPWRLVFSVNSDLF